MKPDEIAEEISQLDLAERLILVEKIWDQIARNNSVLPLPEWQKAELDKRYGDYKNENLQLHDWEGIHQALRER